MGATRNTLIAMLAFGQCNEIVCTEYVQYSRRLEKALSKSMSRLDSGVGICLPFQGAIIVPLETRACGASLPCLPC